VRRKGIGTFATGLIVFLAVYLGFLFMTSHQYRFLIPATLVLPPILALLFDRILDWIGEARATFYRRTIGFLVILANVAVFLFFIANIHYFEVKFRYVTGYYNQAEYILEIGGQ
ncbi:MAG: hypothetical protein AAB518_03380, partial [Patescibacteria group bacterium]